jgi:hypothetical protein
MTDRDLLELAAKAAGMWNDTDPWNGMLKSTGQYWNPLTDDGDALRLAVKLEMIITCAQKTSVYVGVQPNNILERQKNDPFAATRRAIVRAAAEIGRAL